MTVPRRTWRRTRENLGALPNSDAGSDGSGVALAFPRPSVLVGPRERYATRAAGRL